MLKHLLQIILTLTLLSQGFTPFAQHKISGTLTDQYQEIVPFAYVSIRGLSHYWNEAARTNLDGFYEFDSLQTGEYEIWFENIGMETQRFTIQLSKDTSLNVSLLDLPYELEEFKVFARSIPLIQKDGEPPVFHDTTGMECKIDSLKSEGIISTGKEFRTHLENYLSYPEKAKLLGIQGRVFAQFSIDEEGMVQDVKILRGVSDCLDKMVISALLTLPKFELKEKYPNSRYDDHTEGYETVKYWIPILFYLE